jgi:ABC-type nickel/cobalt efflux system permease component RcnA
LLVFGVGIASLAFYSDLSWYGDLIVLAFGGGVAIGGVAILAVLVGEVRGPETW